jgi:uncharacterized protein YndB with AHSA1/START domain
MPKQKDLKRLIRARMRKTGESYTAARAHVRGAPPDKATLAKPTVARPPKREDHATLAGFTDATIEAKTGRSWAAWVALLDDANAAKLSHREIAELVYAQGVSGWWSQAVAVGYERIRGLREIGQRRDGSYEASKSKTIAAPVRALYRAFTHAPTRKRWLPAPVKIRSSVANKTVRITWHDGSSVEAYLVAKGSAKTQVSIQHRKLRDKAAIASSKQYWTERLAALDRLLRAA